MGKSTEAKWEFFRIFGNIVGDLVDLFVVSYSFNFFFLASFIRSSK